MTEEQPTYLKQFRIDLMVDFDSMLEKRFDGFALMMKRQFDFVDGKIEALRDDVANIKQTMATKEDIKYMVVKDDIKNMVVKDDIKNMATRADLVALEQRMEQKMATKEDIQGLDAHIGRFERRIEPIEDVIFEKRSVRQIFKKAIGV